MYDSKEGGWGWLVTAASFLVHVIVGGIGYSCGVWQMIFTGYFGKTRYETAWIGSTLLALTAIGGIPSTVISYRFGYRASVISGSLLASAGFAMSYFCTELHELYLSIGVVAGLGLGLVLTPSVMVLENYFYRKRHLASSLAATGTSVGLILFPTAIYYLEDIYAWKGVTLILVAVCANMIVCGAVMRQAVHYSGRQRRDLLKIFEPSLFKSVVFQGLLWSNFLWSAGAAIVFFHLPEYARSTGVTQDDALMLLGVIGVSNFLSRSVFQLFSHSAKLDTMSNVLCSAGLAVILTGLFPEFFKHKAGEIGYAIMFGLHCGFWSTFVASVTGELLSEELIAYGRGFISLSIGLGLVLGPPLAGLLIDEDFGFEVVFYGAGACMLLSSLIMLSVSIKKCHYRPVADVSTTNSSSSLGTRSVVSAGATTATAATPEDHVRVTSVMTSV